MLHRLVTGTSYGCWSGWRRRYESPGSSAPLSCCQREVIMTPPKPSVSGLMLPARGMNDPRLPGPDQREQQPQQRSRVSSPYDSILYSVEVGERSEGSLEFESGDGAGEESLLIKK